MKKHTNILAGTIIGAIALFTVPAFAQTNAAKTEVKTSTTIRPFRAHISDAAVADLRQRVANTRWAEKETVTDRSQGAQLEKIQSLVKYWGTDYDWRKAEAKLNALPQFITNYHPYNIKASTLIRGGFLGEGRGDRIVAIM